MEKKTHYAPAETADPKLLIHQMKAIATNPVLKNILDAIPEAVLILNKQRQIVYVNESARDIVDNADFQAIMGLRVGEMLNCSHSGETSGGCGTTESCAFCGAVNTILSSQKGNAAVEEARITMKNGESLDLKVKASPFYDQDELYTVFSLTDISEEKRKKVLERTFFHDILNTASGLSGFSELLLDASQSEVDEYKQIIHKLSQSIIDEINAQRLLINAENNELETSEEKANSLELLQQVVDFYAMNPVTTQKTIVIDTASEAVEFVVDRVLLSRVLGNMVKNALEASDPGATIQVSCRKMDDQIEFDVNNPKVIPREIGLQIFKRSFSTKGSGRGIGTYSMKMLSEKYLNGSVRFESNELNGTTFTASYPINLSSSE
jgi:K+-sensing histidine kinase KdpD